MVRRMLRRMVRRMVRRMLRSTPAKHTSDINLLISRLMDRWRDWQRRRKITTTW